MKIKKFLVQMEFPDETRWTQTDNHVAQDIAQCAAAAVRLSTSGPVPMVSVTPEETPAP